jgi:hypothetical protein
MNADQASRHTSNDSSNPATALVAYVTDRQQRGDLVGDDPDVVVGALQSVPLRDQRLVRGMPSARKLRA